MNSKSKRTLTIELWIEDGNAMAEIMDGESGDQVCIVKPYSPDEHPEFNERVGNELYDWLMFLEEETEDC